MKILEEKNIKEGDIIKIETKKGEYIGRLMPRTYYNPDVVVIKLDNGYNIGISFDDITSIEKIQERERIERVEEEKIEKLPGKPEIAILSTGGTIASKVDYRTGGVEPLMTASDLFRYVPELKEIGNIEPKTIMKVFSENMHLEYYEKLSEEIYKEIKNGRDGIIVAHGTDTMHYSSSAMSFALQNLPIPIVFVGAQRSSDRGSSDAGINLISSAVFSTQDVAGVFVVMHEGIGDETCLSHLGTRVRKMHTSRRDAFQSINTKPVARIFWRERKVEFINKEFVLTRNKDREVEKKNKFEKKVGLVKIYPGISGEIIDLFVDKKYRGLVIEGTGLGHAPEYIFESIKNAAENMIVCMTSQTIYGRVNMNVYSTGRDLLKMGVIPCEMIPETTFVKLSWALGNYNEDEAKTILKKNIAGEIFERII